MTHAANQGSTRRPGPGRGRCVRTGWSKSNKKATFQGVTDRSVLQGTNTRTVELHVLTGNPHNEQTLVAWLPTERHPLPVRHDQSPGTERQIPPPTATITNFYENLARLKIQPEQSSAAMAPASPRARI